VTIGRVTLLGSLLRRGVLVRALLSFGAAFTAEWAFTVGIGLVAYAEGGAVAVGIVGFVRLLPAAVLAPVVGAYADRVPRERVLIASSLVRGTSTVCAAAVLIAGGPVLLVYGLAVISTVAFTPFRAAHSALLPSLCRTPEELTMANVVRGALDSLSVIVGSLLAALLVALVDVAAVLAFAGASALVSAALLVGLRYERIPVPAPASPRLAAQVRDGMAAVGAHAGLADVVGLVVLQAAIRGLFNVFVVVVAIDLLQGPESDVGVLTGALGIGALAGSVACGLLVGSRAMARWLGLAVVLWGAPLAVMGLVELRVVALVAAATIGVGNALVDVSAFTLIARLAPNDVLARVFGVLESLGALAVGIGALVAPALIALLGAPRALVVAGLVAPVVCALRWRRLRAIDRAVAVRTDDIALLRQVPMLRPLPVPVLEQLAIGLVPRQVGKGEAVFEAGDDGDVFYVVRSGSVEVLDGDRRVRDLGAGEGFGELALLGSTPRTMTVRAASDVELRAIPSHLFLPAVTSMAGARAAAEATSRGYLGIDPGPLGRDPERD
jgi:MFS family permease